MYFSNFKSTLKKWDQILFPEQQIYARKLAVWSQIVFVVIVAGLMSVVARIFPADGFTGNDWVDYFGKGHVDIIYPPWGDWVVSLLTWELLIGLSVAGVCLAIIKRAVHPLSAVCALVTLPLFGVLFAGQLEGLITLGLTALPWLTPLALLKVQVSTFAFGARRNYVIAWFVWIFISLLIWGPWPLVMLGFEDYYVTGRLLHDISLRGWGIPIALVLFWLARGDMDALMFAGAFATLYLLPYNLLPATPAIARLKPLSALIASVLSWIPLLVANWLGPSGWWLGWLHISFVLFCLLAARYPHFAANAKWRKYLVRATEPINKTN